MRKCQTQIVRIVFYDILRYSSIPFSSTFVSMAAGLYDITNEILGKGHFAIVKLAKHCLTGEHVAVKIIDKSKLNKEGLEQLSSEIRLWSILSEHEHPNVVKLYQCIDTRTKLYLVMEYCGGEVCDLYDYIQKKNDGNGLEENEARNIFRQVCNAILYCHSLKIVHRDLKPENILIINNQNLKNAKNDSNPIVKLIDFGFSNQWSENELLRTSCGSLAYSAPEILLGNHYYGPKVDIWALGCILYILLYGCNPFMQSNDNETLIKILDCSFSTPEKPSVNELSLDLVKGLLKKVPETRLSIEEIINHFWLENKDLTFSCSVKNEGFKISVHEHIIDQMIDQGIGLSKDDIKKIIKNEQSEISPDCVNKKEDGTDISCKVNDHHYIKATYHLLKDKSLRECKGFNQIVNTKRGNILKKPNHCNYKRFNLNQDKNLTSKPNPRSLKLKQNFCNLEVPQTPNSVVLPLARKCSIVSEEGSISTETNLSDVGVSEKREIQEENTQTDVDIFVTDLSADSNLNIQQFKESVSDFSINPNDENNKDRLHKELTIHPVSSSPDFLNSGTFGNDQMDIKLKTYDPNSNEYDRNEDFDLSDFNKDTIIDRYRNYNSKNIKLNNVRVVNNKAPTISSMIPNYQSNKSPSMRVIIQSKSLNNIAIVEQTEAKIANSISSVNIKQSKSEKTDCCTMF